jgi:two-component system, OmpR family, sensor kinase
MLARSLQRRVIIIALIAVATVVLVVDVAITASLRSELDREVARAMRARVALVEEMDDGRAIDELVGHLSDRAVPAIVTSPDGERIETRPDGELLPDGPFARTRVRLSDGSTVDVLVSRARTDNAQQRVFATTLAGSLLALTGLVVILELFSDRLLRPLNDVIATAREIAQGRTGARLAPERTDTEIWQLGAAFDAMLDAQEAALMAARTEEARSRRFLADAAHQLRTPVAGLRAASEALFHDPATRERDRLLGNLAREAARTGRLLDALLRVAHLDRGDPLARAPADLAALMVEEVDRQRSLAPSLEFRLRVWEDDMTIVCDADAVREAVANVLDNARRHARHVVAVHVDATDEWALIRIVDDGPGLRPGTEEQVFERFASLDDRGGSGLGLPIARGIARVHGGDVRWVDGGFELTLARTGDRSGGLAPPR